MGKTLKKLPREAFTFDAKLSFAEPPVEAANGKRPITLLARSALPIAHPAWGKIAHDMSGMQLRKEACPLDYAHEGKWDPAFVIGYADTFNASPESGLEVSGFLVSTRPDDLAADVGAKGAAGVPYEASIDWNGSGSLIEEVGEGVTVQVNGYDFVGPGYVVRQWPLRSIAICPYGSDSNTRTQFADSDSPQFVEIEITQSEPPTMSKPTDAKQQTESTSPAASPPNATPLADPRAAVTAELKRFTDRFGAENGAKWFTENKSFEAALDEHAKSLEAASKIRETEFADLKSRLDAAKPGEPKPVSFTDAETNAKPKQFSNLSDNVAKVAAGIKLPKAK